MDRSNPARFAAWVVFVLLTPGLVGCGRADSRLTPSEPSPVQPPVSASPVASSVSPSQLIVFTDPLTGLSTSDVRDAHDRVVQFTTGGDVVWTVDGTHFPNHPVQGPGHSLFGNIAPEPSCACWLVVRFGASNGERRAYLTADYGHFNPRTMVALEITGSALIVERTDVFPPGTYTLSGIVTEGTENGPAPLENASVYRLNQEGGGWDDTTTDRNGFYQIQGLADGSRVTGFSKNGYQKVEQSDFPIHGNTRLDVQLVRR
jgi:hypothetical protein